MSGIIYTIKPIWDTDRVKKLDVSIKYSGSARNGEVLLRKMTTGASIPCAVLEGIELEDDAGRLDIEKRQEDGEYPHVKNEAWVAMRDTCGDIAVRYTAHTRKLPENYSSSPYFDLRDEPGGASGAGWTFLPEPPGEETCFEIHWDSSAMPQGCGCISDGGIDTPICGSTKNESIGFSYYAFGKLNTWQDTEYPPFTFVWFGEAGFDAQALSGYIEQLYKQMSAFFGSPNAKYTVYARRDPFPSSGGGTALGKAFMFGYSAFKNPALGEIKTLLSHEMVHNWPSIEQEKGSENWYSEGTAEYYCCLLPFRFGIMTEQEFVTEVNRKLGDFYHNKYRELPADEAAELYWEKRDTQRLPYGRGLLYFIESDAVIRSCTNGRHSVDDIVLEIQRRKDAGVKSGVASWLDMYAQLTGIPQERVRERYECMQSGELMKLHEDAYGGKFDIQEVIEPLFDIGFDYDASYRGAAPVLCGVNADGPAYRAGLRNGDILEKAVYPRDILKSGSSTACLTVIKDGKRQEFKYECSGKQAVCYKLKLKNI